MGKLGPWTTYSFQTVIKTRFHCTLSKLWAPNVIWDILDVMQAEKRTYICGLNSPLFLLFQRLCDEYQRFDFGIFCHLLVHGDILGGDPLPGIWKVSFTHFFSSFSSAFLFYSSFSFFFVSLGGPLSYGPLDTVHPCHPVATPLVTYRTRIMTKVPLVYHASILRYFNWMNRVTGGVPTDQVPTEQVPC